MIAKLVLPQTLLQIPLIDFQTQTRSISFRLLTSLVLLLLVFSMISKWKIKLILRNLKLLIMKKNDLFICLFLLIWFVACVLICSLSSCSVLAISAGKAANTITQTTSTTTTTRLDSISVLPNYKNSKK